MRHSIEALSEREKETLRLLLAGHDAKSIARHFGLSVHTINERLREARRKLGVSSSREAARLLAEVEQQSPKSHAYNEFGVGSAAGTPINRSVWIAGGTLIMIVVVAAFALLSGAPDSSFSPRAAPPAVASADVRAAQTWLGLVDTGRWHESWRGAGAAFKSQVPEGQWVTMVQQVRTPLGRVSSRAFMSLTKISSLPGLPPGEYESMQFQTDFAGKKGAIETVGLAHERSGWKVIGYFIR